jgi:DNA-binding NtrC family response regulator
LNVIRIHVPALRERKADIPLLIEKINHIESDLIHQTAPTYSQSALDLLSDYHWPGNVRELKNLVKRMIILKSSGRVSINDVEKMIELKHITDQHADGCLPTLAESERHTIEKALIKCNGVIGGQNGAARLLGIARSTLQYRMNKHGIKAKKLVSLNG